jgi:RNA polymerase sigma factor (sigma-70 family)
MTEDEREHQELLRAHVAYIYPQNEDAFSAATDRLYDLLEPKLRAFIFGRLSSLDAVEVLQDTMIATFQNMHKFRGGKPKAFGPTFWAWCFRIARNKINDHIRKNKYSRMEPLPIEDLQNLIEKYHELADVSAGDRLDCEQAMAILAKTKPDCWDCLWNRYMAGMEFLQLAKFYEIEYDAMRRRIERCLKRLKKIFLKLYE